MVSPTKHYKSTVVIVVHEISEADVSDHFLEC